MTFTNKNILRISLMLILSFSFFKGNAQAQKRDIYELRSYESATEKLFFNKVVMFNNGEIDIFKNPNFNSIFFGEVLAGHNMPNLMYMTAFKDKAIREAHWKVFTEHPDWRKMSSMIKYQNNLHPTSYSEI